MVDKYLIDTSIWIDLYEDRKGFNGEPLGEYAEKLILKIWSNKNIIVITDILIMELERKLSLSEIRGMFKPFESVIEKWLMTSSQDEEAKKIAMLRNVPKGDALHAIFARDNNSILITRDKHFKKLLDISMSYMPEDII